MSASGSYMMKDLFLAMIISKCSDENEMQRTSKEVSEEKIF